MTYEEAVAAVPVGHYRHFKGNHYKVLSIARHSETSEPMVVYQALYGEGGIWVRPAEMWNELVTRDGKTFPRFQRISREQRIAFYEEIFNELQAADPAAGISGELQSKCRFLEEYYISGEWREDYEADEAGQVSPDLKRGVLSQDGVYDLLERLGGAPGRVGE